MQIDSRPPTTKNPPEQFTGEVWLDPIAQPRTDGQRMFVAKVRFAPGARTAWHSHARGQTLQITQGVAWIQSRGQDKVIAYPGQTVYCPPDEEHWHGAASDSFMEHLAMLDIAEDPAGTTTWLEHVTDVDYHSQGVFVSWDSTELEQVGTATELELAARRPDDTLSRFTVMWVVRVGASLYVRSAYGPDSAWYRRAVQYGRARVRTGGVERDVVLEHLASDDDVHGEIDAAFHAKYDQYGPQIVGTVVGADAASVTLRLDRAPSPPSR